MKIRSIIGFVNICSLVLLLATAVWYGVGNLQEKPFKTLMLVFSLLWFIGSFVSGMLRNRRAVSHFLLVGLLIFSMTGCNKQTESTNGQWTKEMAWAWFEENGWRSGCNFQPSTAVNQLEMWQEETFDPVTIHRELGWAEDLGFTLLRVYLHSYAWKQDPGGFKERLHQFLEIADGHGMGTMMVFFDDCWNEVAQSGPQPEPLTGIHNSRWVQDPSVDLRQDTTALFPWLEVYVRDILNTFRDDRRILVWDLYNEPGNSNHQNSSLPLLKKIFLWAREVNPSQPLTCGIWRLDLDELNEFQTTHSDIISYHNYQDPDRHRVWIHLLKTHGRPMICSEYLARHYDSRFQNILPLLKEQHVWAINWGLVAGKTNTIYPWNEPMPEGGEPEIWFTDILRRDGTAFDKEETTLIRQLNQ
jgi:hypothetical protein